MIYDNVYEEFLSRSGTHRYSRYFVSTCLFHDDHHPSMFVYPDGYYCQGCGAGGSLEYLLRIIRGKPQRPARREERKYKLTPWWYLNSIESYCMKAHENLCEHTELFMYYLEKRGIAGLTNQQKFGYQDGYYIFPIWDSGRIVGAVGRAGECRQEMGAPRYSQPNKQPPQIINPDISRSGNARVLHLPFGIIDMLTLYQAGFAAISYSAGKSINPELLAPYRKQIVIIPDKGEERNARRLWRQLGWRGKLLFPDWPEDCKDPNDLWVKHPEQFYQILDFPQEMICSLQILGSTLSA